MSVSRLWECRQCTFQNRPADAKCAKCSVPHISPSTGERKSRAEGSASGKARWRCERQTGSGGLCGTVNRIDQTFCSQCRGRVPYFPPLVSEAEVERQLLEAMTEPTLTENGNTGRDPETDRATADPSLAAVTASTRRQTEDNKLSGQRERTQPKEVEVANLQGREAALDSRREERAAAAAAVGPAACASNVRLSAAEEEGAVAFPEEECRLVLVGKTGNGKSSTANTILGLERFQHSPSFQSTTLRCQRHNNLRFGIRLEVVDTPGFFDTAFDMETVKTEVAKCFGIVAPGPHAIVIVLRIGVKFTAEEIQVVEKLDEVFGEQLLRFLVIVFTHGDLLDRRRGERGEGEEEEEGAESALRRMLAGSPEKLRELIDRVNNRYVVFDNTASQASKNQQVRKLLQTVRGLLAVNRGRPYTTQLLERAEQCMQSRQEQLQQQLQEGGGRGRGEGEGGTDPGHGHQGATNVACRDMARQEVVTESGPLLDQVKASIMPLVTTTLTMLAQVLIRKLLDMAFKKNEAS